MASLSWHPTHVRIALRELFYEGQAGVNGVRRIVRPELAGQPPNQHQSLGVGYRVHGARDAVTFRTVEDVEGYLLFLPCADYTRLGIATRLGTAPSRILWQGVDEFPDPGVPAQCSVTGCWGSTPHAPVRLRVSTLS